MTTNIDFLKLGNIANEADANNAFHRIAKELLTNHGIKVNNSVYRMTEIEFYLYHPSHLDPSVHCNEKQLNFGSWYFHREKQASLKFSFKGMDLVFGDNDTVNNQKYYGGILIRGIHKIGEEKEVYGPSNTVKRILEEYGVEKVVDLGDNKYKLDGPVQLVNLVTPVEKLYTFPRVGLKNYDQKWIDIQYRFRPDSKGKKGK